MDIEDNSDLQDTPIKFPSIDRMSIDGLADHLARRHGIALEAPHRYLPGHRRNHAERLHSQAHGGQVDDHRHESMTSSNPPSKSVIKRLEVQTPELAVATEVLRAGLHESDELARAGEQVGYESAYRALRRAVVQVVRE